MMTKQNVTVLEYQAKVMNAWKEALGVSAKGSNVHRQRERKVLRSQRKM